MKDDLFEMLIDPHNNETIEMYDSKGNQYDFEKVAIISDNQERKVYCLLKPIYNGISDSRVIVFLVCIGDDGIAFLKAEEDEKVIQKVFNSYLNFLKD